MAMGASAFAMARPLLEAAHKGRSHAERVESVIEVIDTLVEELRIAMFCTGSRNVEQLRTRLNPELQSKQSEKKR
jgi:isopentenyl-diphosphate delta-isomerase